MDVVARMENALAAATAPEKVRTYLHEYTGRYFELIGGLESRAASANVITSHDLVAVSMLSVDIPSATSAELLLGTLGIEVATLLTEIPTTVRMGTREAADHLGEGSAAWSLWNLLDNQLGMGATKVSKLMARKRPHLIPVYDAVVACYAGRPKNYWLEWQTALERDDSVTDLLRGLRAIARTPDFVSDLRLLDIVLWLTHEAEHRLEHGVPRPTSASALEFESEA